MSGASLDKLEALVLCVTDARGQSRKAIGDAHERGFRAPTDEERERQRFDAARYLLEHGNEAQRALAIGFLARLAGSPA